MEHNHAKQRSITAKTALTAVTGFPLVHSLSPVLHNFAYEQLGLDATMLAFEQQNIESFIAAVRTLNIPLVAVTLPHKQTVMNLLDEIDPIAKTIGAVNTIININGKLKGYNTDIVGIAEALKDAKISQKNVLLLGAGGAAYPVAYYVNQQGGKLFCINRTEQKADELTKIFGGKVLKQQELHQKSFDVIINTTPLGMAPNSNESPLDPKIFQPNQTVFDIIYNPLQTQLLKNAQAAGAKTISGLPMFIAQGLEQIRLWSGNKFNSEITKKLTDLLNTHLRNQ